MDYVIRDQAQALRERVGEIGRQGKVITVASGKGGVGKSSISVNLAIALESLGRRVLVVDADFGLANVDVMLGTQAKYNLSHYLSGERGLSQIIQKGYGGVQFISGGSGLRELLAMNERELRGIIEELKRDTRQADVIIFDAGAGIDDNVLQMISASSETILVTTPEPTAMLDAYALVKTLAAQQYTAPIRLLLNKGESRRESERAMAGLQQIAEKYLGVELSPLGHVLYSDDVPRSIKGQTPVLISRPRGQTAREITQIAQALLDMPEPEGGGLFARVFSRFK